MAGTEDNRELLVNNFCVITSATRDVALFFLESHNWTLDAAVQSFYDDDGSTNILEPHQHQLPSDLTGPHRQAHRIDEDEDDDKAGDDDDDEDYFPPEFDAPPPGATRQNTSSGSNNNRSSSRPSGSRATIRTLADLNRSPVPDDDSDEPQEYYTGGEKSGMLVQDPSEGKHNADSVFERARRMGAIQGPHQTSSSSRSFTGTGRLLSGETVPSAPQQPENNVHNIYFWRDGFSVDDGPLRSFNDPANASFLESVIKSECPKELEPADRRSQVHVNLVRKEENYPEPVRHTSAFQGVGRTLGSGSSDRPVTETNATEASMAETAATSAQSASITLPHVGLSVDGSRPSTSIRLRLADGTRMVAHFNTHHTVGDIRAFIDASRSGAARNYQLQTVDFPPKQLNDLSQTIEEAGLGNSVIIQRNS